jgi:arylsulfatase A-like enzyme
MDLHLNRFVEFLKKENLWENSIIIIVGDHGEHLGEHNIYYNHIASIYQPSLRVPLLIKIPKTNAGKTNALTESIDIMPTILDALNIPKENYIEGKSLIPLINNQSGKVRDYAFAETGVSLFEQNKRWYFSGVKGKWKMITDGKYKLILIPHPENDIYELYNLEADPNETRNLINDEKEIADSLKQKLFAWMQKEPIEKTQPFTQKEEEKVKERLRRLGYLD